MSNTEYLNLIEQKLQELIPEETCLYSKLFEAMRYSLLCGGKRIRPVLVLEFCHLCGGDIHAALPYACAVEMIHTYSLIHDDLPCMDNDGMRRGKPSNHVVHGESTALLAGDALLTMAFEVMLSPQNIAGVGAARAAKAGSILAHAAGAHGMIGGQVIDLMSEGKQVNIETLQKMDEHKTSALIIAAAQIGCSLGKASNSQRNAAKEYAADIGFAFQIVDDILDVVSDTQTLGKPVGSDIGNEKCTYVSLWGLEAAQEQVNKLTQKAIAALDAFEEDTQRLASLAESLSQRKK